MGGRGSSSGMSVKGRKYGSQYHTVLTDGNIKFVEKNDRASEQFAPCIKPQQGLNRC